MNCLWIPALALVRVYGNVIDEKNGVPEIAIELHPGLAVAGFHAIRSRSRGSQQSTVGAVLQGV